MASELEQLAHLDRVAVQVGEEEAHPFGLLRHLLERRGARQQQHLVRFLRLGGKDLAPVDHVVVALALGEGLDMGDVVAGVGFGHGEGGVQLAADHTRQMASLHLLAAVHHDRREAEDRQMDRAGGVHCARVRDLAHDQCGLGDAEPATAVFLGNRHAQVAGLGHGLVEVVRKFVRGVFGRASTRRRSARTARAHH